VELTLERIGGKWKTVILARLKDAPMRYGELRQAIPDLSEKILSQRLRNLQEAGFVELIDGGNDGRRRYALTDHGRSLQPVLEALGAWGEAIGHAEGVRFRPSNCESPDGQRGSTGERRSSLTGQIAERVGD
jgi:DNA-binding HxlR family transcriptional regulator